MEDRITFPVGDITLEGLLSLPAGSSNVGVVVCHPHPLYGGDMQNNVVSVLTEAFQAAGMATLRFNFRGVGDSGGSHDEGRAEQDDVKAAVTCLLGRASPRVVAVAGYSFGSMVGLRAAADDPRVHKLIGVALPVGMRDCSFLRTVTKPKLLIVGDRDDYAPLEKVDALFASLSEPKTREIVTGADHFFAGAEARVAGPATAFLSA